MALNFSMSSLNPPQREAVNTLTGPVLILAGAGTGKTRTVTCRIAAMVEQGIAADSIMALTFTNKAANEMRERIGDMISKKAAEELMVSTFHSLCVRILRTGIEHLGFKKNFSIYTGSDQASLVKQIIIRKGGKDEKLEPRQVLAELSRVKNSGLGVEAITDDLIKIVAQAYQDELRAQNSVDFDDLLILGEKLMREYADVREHWRERFRYVMVDEFQDTNSLQMDLLKQLVGVENNICVVGDDDQSIYGWRGADIGNILGFEKFFPDPKVILLEENYRCSAPILEAANGLIKNNAGRREKALWTSRAGGEMVRLMKMPGDREEAEYIIDEIYETNRVEKRKWEDFAILYRTNTQSRVIEEALREKDIPYRMVGGQSFFDRKEVKDLLSYLAVLVNPDADVHLLRILNHPPRGIGQKTAILATDHSREKQTSVWDALKDEAFTSQMGPKAQRSMAEFVEIIKEFSDRAHDSSENHGTMLKELTERIELSDFVERSSKSPAEADKRKETIHSLIDSLTAFSGPKKTVQDFLTKTALDSDKDDDIENQKGVCLITLHASKGLEFPLVYLVGLEQGILPHKRSIDSGTTDEERRLLYVGMTRAEERLTMSYCGHRLRYGEEVWCQPSVFLDELDHDKIQFEDYEEMMNAEVTEEETENFFGSLKDLLS